MFIYFSYHALMGDRGYLKYMGLQHQVQDVSAQLASLKTEREQLESKVVQMRPGSINYDLLEERVRLVLGYSFSDELTFIDNK